MTSVRPRYLPIPSQDSPEFGRLILRDGTTATIRLTTREDQTSPCEIFQCAFRRFKASPFF